MSETAIFVRTRADGTLLEVRPDGTEQPVPHKPMLRMTEEEIHAAALADPDAQTLAGQQRG